MLKIVGLFLVLLAIIGLTTFSVVNDFGSGEDGGNVDKAAVRKIVAEYIKNNPQAILDSVSTYQKEAAAGANKEAQKNVKNKIGELENDPTSPIAGNPKGDVVVVEFFDYSCGYCKKALPTIVGLLESDKNVKVVFKEMPILGPNSLLSSKAAVAVHLMAPDKYFEFHKKLMSGPRVSGQASINKIANGLGIDATKLEEKMKSSDVGSIIAKDKALATSIGIRGTPAFVVGGELVPGAVNIATLKALVTKARAKN